MSDNMTSILNDLVETSKDGEKGFRTAAEDTKNAELQAVFLRRAQDCATGAADLVWSKNSNHLKRHEFQGEIAERT